MEIEQQRSLEQNRWNVERASKSQILLETEIQRIKTSSHLKDGCILNINLGKFLSITVAERTNLKPEKRMRYSNKMADNLRIHRKALSCLYQIEDRWVEEG